MCVTIRLCVCIVIVFMPSDSVAKFTWRNSAYLSGSKCITFVICIYSFCFFDRVSSILTSLALTILHCYTDCHVESKTPPLKHTILPDYSVRQCALVEVSGFAPLSTTTFKQLLRIMESVFWLLLGLSQNYSNHKLP